MSTWEVIVGNVGTVYSGEDERKARSDYEAYVAISISGVGRAGDEEVTLICDGEPEAEYLGRGREPEPGACTCEREPEPTHTTEPDLTPEQRVSGLDIILTCRLMDPGGSDWEVTLEHGRASYTTPFHQGSAFRTWRKGAARQIRMGELSGFTPDGLYFRTDGSTVLGKVRDGERAELYGRRLHPVQSADLRAWFTEWTEPTAPTLCDVLSCLLCDASGVRWGQGFDEFCNEFGYSNDSIKARECFEGCRNSWAGLVRLGLDLDDLERRFDGF